MTLEEFLAALGKTPRDWYVDDFSRIRRKARIHEQCPISALRHQPDLHAWRVARQLGIEVVLASKIQDAADFARKHLRPKLLRACGLEVSA